MKDVADGSAHRRKHKRISRATAVRTACVYKECEAFASQTSDQRASIFDRIENRAVQSWTVNIRSTVYIRGPVGGGGFRMSGHPKGLGQFPFELILSCTPTNSHSYEYIRERLLFIKPGEIGATPRFVFQSIISGCILWPHLIHPEQRTGPIL